VRAERQLANILNQLQKSRDAMVSGWARKLLKESGKEKRVGRAVKKRTKPVGTAA
jgi:uncharacterized protein YukE